MEKEQEQSSLQVGVVNDDLYDVVMLNDDFTSMDFVVEVLKAVFFHNAATATTMMLTIHKKGECIVGTYTLDIAQSKQQKAANLAQKADFPLRIKIIKHKS